MRIEAHLLTRPRELRIAAVFCGDEAQGAFASKEVSGGRKLSAHAPLPSSVQEDEVRSKGMYVAHYPLTVGKCQEMREAWGASLKIHKGLGDWYREAVQEHAAQVATTKQTDADLPVLRQAYPELNAYLKGDQRVTAHWIANAYRGGGLLADEVGTGKTVGVVAGLVEAQVRGNILIVCPKISVRAVWYKEIAKHTDIPVYACRGSRIQRERKLAAFLADRSACKILVVVGEMLRIKAVRDRGRIRKHLGFEYPGLFDIDWSAVVVDESHKMLGKMDVVKANLAGEGLRALSYAPQPLKLAVSATPFGKGGRIEAMFGTLYWLWPDEYSSRWAWLRKYFRVDEEVVFVKGGRGATQTVQRVGGLLPGMTEEKFWADLGPRILRRTMEEVSPEHRGLKNWVQVSCEMESTQATQYRKFAEDAELPVTGGIITTVGTLDYMTRCRQFANGALRMEGGRVVYTGDSSKIDRLMAHLDQLDPSRKLVITSQYNEFLDCVEDRLDKEGYEWYRLDGKTPEWEREWAMAEFQGEEIFTGPGITCRKCSVGHGRRHGTRCLGDRASIFLINSQAGGVSITLDAAEEMHQLDRMYPPEANTQLYGRIFRRGRAHEVLYYLYESEGTIDEAITAKTEAGHAEQMRMLDGRRGLEYIRALAAYQPPEG